MEYKVFEEGVLNGRLGKAIAKVVGKPGSLRFRLARGTSAIGRWAKDLERSGWRGGPRCGRVTVGRTYGRGKLSIA